MTSPTNPPLSTRRELLRVGVGTVVGSCLTLGLLDRGRVSAARRARTVPTPSPGAPPRRISMVGDSLTVGTMRYQHDDLVAAGWSQATIDAYVSRGIRTKMRADAHTGITAVDAIRKTSGDTEAWIVGLGTNDAVIYSKNKHADVIAQMMDHIGRGHRVLWINVYLPDRAALQDSWNSALEVIARDRGDMTVFDWATVVRRHKRWVASDGLHCSPYGYEQRSQLVGAASKVLLPAGLDRTRLAPMVLVNVD